MSYTQFKRLWQYIVTRTAKERSYYRYEDGKRVKHTVTPVLGEKAAHNGKVIYSLDFDLVTLAEKYIMSNIHWHVKFDGSLQRKEIPEIPADAIREALFNSFCHKDFGACQSNEVAIYKDRVEIYNPG